MKKALNEKITEVVARERGKIEDNLTEIFCILGEIDTYLSEVEKEIECGRGYPLVATAPLNDLSYIDEQLSSLKASIEFMEILDRELWS